MHDINISLNQLKTMLNYTGNGKFATKAESTSGVLQLDGSGKLQNANRHWYSRDAVCTDGQRNLRLRQALVSAFAANGASADFMTQLRDRLGLDENLLSSGRIDEKGEVMSAKPLERRELKRLITAFESGRKDRGELDDRDVDQVKPHTDAFTQRLSEMKAAGLTFLEELRGRLEAETSVFKSEVRGAGPSSDNLKLNFGEVDMQKIEYRLSELAEEVADGKRSVPSALEALADTIDRTIGFRSFGARSLHDSEIAIRQKVVVKALDNFARALGVQGDHPLESALRENLRAKTVNEFLRKPFPTKKADTIRLNFLVDFAERTYEATKLTLNLINLSREARGAGSVSMSEFYDNTMPGIVKACCAQKNDFAEFLGHFKQGKDPVMKGLVNERISKMADDSFEGPLNDAAVAAKSAIEEADQATLVKFNELKAERDKGDAADKDEISRLDRELVALQDKVRQARLEYQYKSPMMKLVATQTILSCFCEGNGGPVGSN